MLKRFFNLIMFGLFADDSQGSAGPVSKPDDKPAGVQDTTVDDDSKNQKGDITIRLNKLNDENKTLKDQIAASDKEKADKEKKQLEQQGKYQEVAELAEKRAKEAEEKATKAETAKIDNAREFEIGLEAKDQGINDIKDAIKLINIAEITTNDDGTFLGIKEAIEKLKTDKPYLFNANGNSPGVHSNKPKGSNTMTREELINAAPDVFNEFKKNHPAECDRLMNEVKK